MNSQFDLIIFGGTGDLSCRKLLPALYNGMVAGLVSDTSRIFLTSRKAVDTLLEDWLTELFEKHTPACGVTERDITRFARMLEMVQLDLGEGGPAWEALAAKLPAEEARPLVHFFAIPPALFAPCSDLVGQYGLSHKHARLVIEKPLGHDRASAASINTQVARYFREEQTFRIDHYLGKEAVQNLLALRFSNIMFEELWSSRTIDHIQITIAENLGVEGRGDFYEGTGAMRDMVQNHLLQLLCLVAMEPPAQLEAEGIRDEKLKVLRALEPLEGALIDERVVRGQYGVGAMGGKAVEDYQTDLQLEVPSQTETFVALKTHIENWRWAGVPFYLRTGKRLPERFAEIAIQFKKVPHAAHKSWGDHISPNRFIISLQPEDRLSLRMMVKDHSIGGESLKEVELNLDMAHGDGAPRPGPYLRLIMDAAAGDQRLFVHRKEVDLAWAWVDRIIGHWQQDKKPLPTYTSGTWGPYEAHDLMNRDGRHWFHESRTKAGSL